MQLSTLKTSLGSYSPKKNRAYFFLLHEYAYSARPEYRIFRSILPHDIRVGVCCIRVSSRQLENIPRVPLLPLFNGDHVIAWLELTDKGGQNRSIIAPRRIQLE